jgi:hypothetical protein
MAGDIGLSLTVTRGVQGAGLTWNASRVNTQSLSLSLIPSSLGLVYLVVILSLRFYNTIPSGKNL